MKKLSFVLAIVLIFSMLLTGCFSHPDYDSDYDYDYESDYSYSYDDDDDDDYSYDYSYSTGSKKLNEYSAFWEKKSTGAKCGIFVSDDAMTLFVAGLYEQYSFDTSVTYKISKVGSYYYLYAGSTKMGDIRLVDSNTIYLDLGSDTPSLNGYYDSVYVLDVDLD